MLDWTDEMLKEYSMPSSPKTKAPFGTGILVYEDLRTGRLVRRPSNSHDMNLSDMDYMREGTRYLGVWEQSVTTWFPEKAPPTLAETFAHAFASWNRRQHKPE